MFLELCSIFLYKLWGTTVRYRGSFLGARGPDAAEKSQSVNSDWQKEEKNEQEKSFYGGSKSGFIIYYFLFTI